MNLNVEAYQDFIAENLDHVNRLTEEAKRWKVIYQKRVFDIQWITPIKEIIDSLHNDIKKNIEECQYYIKRIEEIKYAETHIAQSKENSGDALSARTESQDTNQDTSRIE